MNKLAFLLLLCALSLHGQSNSGELKLKVTDPSGLGVKTAVHVSSAANQYRAILQTDNDGDLVLQRLPFGLYILAIEQTGDCASLTLAALSEPMRTLPSTFSVFNAERSNGGSGAALPAVVLPPALPDAGAAVLFFGI